VQRRRSIRTGFEVSCRGGWDFRDNLVDTVVSPPKQNAGQRASSPETSDVSVQENFKMMALLSFTGPMCLGYVSTWPNFYFTN
jgi:hypothetical protein